MAQRIENKRASERTNERTNEQRNSFIYRLLKCYVPLTLWTYRELHLSRVAWPSPCTPTITSKHDVKIKWESVCIYLRHLISLKPNSLPVFDRVRCFPWFLGEEPDLNDCEARVTRRAQEEGPLRAHFTWISSLPFTPPRTAQNYAFYRKATLVNGCT